MNDLVIELAGEVARRIDLKWCSWMTASGCVFWSIKKNGTWLPIGSASIEFLELAVLSKNRNHHRDRLVRQLSSSLNKV